MHYEEYGERNKPTVVMLHGAFFVNSFEKQYPLSRHYHLLVPHITGYGKEAATDFSTDIAIKEILNLCPIGETLYLIGFSLGAQLAFKLLVEYGELFKKAIIISPWLVNKENIPDTIVEGNLKMLKAMQNKMLAGFIALINGMPKEQRLEWTEYMRNTTEATVINSVKNGISFDTVPGFEHMNVPILALAGSKEPDNILESVKLMAEKNKNCTGEIWQGAKHTIPLAFAKRLNNTIAEFFV